MHLVGVQHQIYWSAPSRDLDHGRRRTAFALVLVLGCERLLREGRIVGRAARLAAAQAQAARLVAVEATGARWPTRRGDLLRRRAPDGLADALARRAGAEAPSSASRLVAAHDLLEEVVEWLGRGELAGASVPSAIDRLRVAQALLLEHRWHDDGPAAPAAAPAARDVVPNAWQDDD